MTFDEKTLKKVIKEGGKRGVEIDGAATMGGLQYFCTKVDEPNGNWELLVKCVEAMNAEVDEAEEERKGGSGAIGKMVFSCDEHVLAVVAYVPADKTKECDAADWLKAVLNQYDGKFIQGDAGLAVGEIRSNPDAGKFTLKIRDEALPKAIAYLRSKGLFPEADSDSDSDFVMGDDYFDEM
ncbi:hypothetical protein BCR44DRAFT_116694 [Catenaria anguillulae PL171]|uniref:Uncharacterized protein n=1 Tax=Catenaria anguillulae PL171 TaxID=765915 RepID=A0A1Y2HKR8_9FUNG|nr:hypothetical protein BCR44DRAFT_116694 [Catenaria anguillulae PL171]